MIQSDTRFSLTTLPWFIGPLFFGCLALFLGQDANWDLRNYHFYNAYSFLFNRFDFDVVPAQLATFYNPLLYVPFYKLVTSVPPMVVGFVMGAVQGLNFPILIGIVRCTAGPQRESWWRSYLVAAVGVLGAGNISETGTMFADNLLSLLVLGVLWLFLANYRFMTERKMSDAFRLLGFGGFLMGAAAGLKQTAVIFPVGWCLALLIIPTSFWRRIFLAFFFGIGVLAGIASTGGFWMYGLWVRFANPLFPYFNQIFHSPMASITDYRDARFLPANLLDALLFPFIFLLDPHRTGEISFRDLRFAVFLVVLALALFFLLWRRLRPGQATGMIVKSGSDAERIRFSRFYLLVGALAAYCVWLKLFGIYRYLLPLEMLAPLGILLLIRTFPWRPTLQDWAAALCAVLILATLQPGNWGRVAWGKAYFGFKTPPLKDPANAMVLMTGLDPISYVIPFFPQTVRFLRIESYFTKPKDIPNGFDLRMQKLIADHRGPLYVLYHGPAAESAEVLSRFNLIIEPDSCTESIPHIEEHQKYFLGFCELKRNSPSEEGDK
ncbi:MAG: hypothetical protein P4L42_04925 [Desulfocapsaceae bacterium]|nr:hypothetical protein [Desulfocapsaceae bacterium]